MTSRKKYALTEEPKWWGGGGGRINVSHSLSPPVLLVEKNGEGALNPLAVSDKRYHFN